MTTAPETSLNGLDLLRAVAPLVSETPGIGRLPGIDVELMEEGRVQIALTTRPDFANTPGDVHGGICATLLDTVTGCAVDTTLEAGVGCSLLENKVSYARTVPTSGSRLTAVGKTIHVGRRAATAEGEVRDEDWRLVVHGTTCVIHR